MSAENDITSGSIIFLIVIFIYYIIIAFFNYVT